MSLIHQTLTPASLEARRLNALKSTGPRTSEGRRRAGLGFFHLVAPGRSLRRSMRALGESPRRFKALLADLVASHQPATPSEMMLVEDLAALRWQRWRCERARTGRLAWQREQIERAKLRREVETHRAAAFDPEALRLHGLRAAPESESHFVELVNLLDRIDEELEKGDFTTCLPGMLRTLYGEQPSGRGASLQSVLARLNQPAGHDNFVDATKAAIRIGVAQESAAVMSEYSCFSRHRGDVTPLLRESSLAPAGSDLQALTREVASIDRQIERKIRLLREMQKARREGFDGAPAALEATQVRAPELEMETEGPEHEDAVSGGSDPESLELAAADPEGVVPEEG